MSIPNLVEAFYERVWNAGDLVAVSELLTEDFSFRGSLGAELRGHEAFKDYVRSVRGALADYRCEILACVAEGELAFAKMRFSGLHVALFRGYHATGLPVQWLGAALFRFERQAIAELWVLGDLAGLDAVLKRNQTALCFAPQDQRNTPSVRIRLAVPEDAPSIASALHESFIEYKALYTEEGFAATALTNERVRTRMTEGPVWVALRNDTIVGTVSAVPKREALYIRGMAILPAARGQGIGELLLRQIESFASDRGFKRLYLSTTPFLSRAIRLYEHFGFRRNVEDTHDLFGTPLFTMEKTLS